MSTHIVNGVELFVEDTGPPHGEENDRRPILFLHGLLWNHRQWEAQMPYFERNHRCVVYDHRGQGRSEVPDTPFIDLETAYLDAAALIEQLDLIPCHVVGMSMGGTVSLRLAVRRPELVQSLTVIGAAAGSEDSERMPKYKLLTWVARFLGTRPVVSQLMPIMFSDHYLDSPRIKTSRRRWRNILASNKPSVYRAVNGFLYRPSILGEIGRIAASTLVIQGEEDRAVDSREGRRIAEAIPRAEFELVDDCGHMVVLEQPERANALIGGFIDAVEEARAESPLEAAE